MIQDFSKQYSVINDSINKETQRVLEDFNNRNILLSTIALEAFIETGMKALLDGIKELLEKINQLNPTIKQWNEIRDDIKYFIKSQYVLIYNEMLRMWDGRFTITNYKFQLFRLEEQIIDEVNICIDGRINILKKDSRIKNIDRIWDIIKILIGALIGYALAKIFK